VTFATVVERFKRLYIEKSKLRTGKVMIQQIEKHLMPTFRDAEFNTIKRRSLMELLDKIEAEHGASMADFDIEFYALRDALSGVQGTIDRLISSTSNPKHLLQSI
jgi:hypothetical protein